MTVVITKKHIEAELRGIVSDRFIELWWDLRLPGLGNVSPNQVYATDPITLWEYVKNYGVVAV